MIDIMIIIDLEGKTIKIFPKFFTLSVRTIWSMEVTRHNISATVYFRA